MRDKFDRDTEFLLLGFGCIQDRMAAFDHAVSIYEDVREHLDAPTPQAGEGDWEHFDEDPVWCCTNIMTLCIETLQSLTPMEQFEIACKAMVLALGDKAEKDELNKDLESLFDFHGGAQ
mgnify:CR=1 FL=1